MLYFVDLVQRDVHLVGVTTPSGADNLKRRLYYLTLSLCAQCSIIASLLTYPESRWQSRMDP
jgi:hypothetical protein